MQSFWSFVQNEQFSVGCTGQTVHVYDRAGKELARFKDLKYGYLPIFSPDGKLLVVKSTAGQLAVYSLETLCLLQKFRFSEVDCAQDDNGCFSPDGRLFYNIERHIDSCKTRLSIYDTERFELVQQYFEDREGLVLNVIEYDAELEDYYVLGDDRLADGQQSFAARLRDGVLDRVTPMDDMLALQLLWYKSVEHSGFSQKRKELYLKSWPPKAALEQLFATQGIRLSDYVTGKR